MQAGQAQLRSNVGEVQAREAGERPRREYRESFFENADQVVPSRLGACPAPGRGFGGARTHADQSPRPVVTYCSRRPRDDPDWTHRCVASEGSGLLWPGRQAWNEDVRLPRWLRSGRIRWYATTASGSAAAHRSCTIPAFAAALRSGYFTEQRRRARLPLERPLERGQFVLGAHMAPEVDEPMGPDYRHVLVTAEPVDQDFTDRLVEAFLHRRSDAADAGEMESR
ncbi:TetR-like C-terminal domain-containing protein [Streptomyces sp. NPDC059819]|uniref:TetR-like C-terminal domain-containing protein n=2 Tax=unclassified Streptomyces TaxID=2593676 RepID=UPI003659B907